MNSSGKQETKKHLFTKFMPLDWISYGYILFNLIYIAIGRERVPNAGFHLGVFLLIAVVLFLLIKLYHKESGWLVTFLRNWYPFILFTYFFELSTIANRVVFPEYLDPFFIRIDEMIFGYQPAIIWGQLTDDIFINELMYFSYFSYYIVVPGIAFLLYFSHKEYFKRYAFTIAFVFYVCYTTYQFLPVVGGRFLPGVPEMTTAYEGGPFQHIMAFIYSSSNHWGSAFPSSHVAVSVAVNIAALQYFRKLGYWLMPLNFLLAISTVYCHYHYFIDTVFGLIYGIGFYFLGTALYRYLKKCSVTDPDREKRDKKREIVQGES